MTVFILCNVFEEIDNLSRMWASAQTVFPDTFLVAVDGRYPAFDCDHDFSADGTLEWCEENGSLLLLAGDECAKRTQGLGFIDHVAAEGDFVCYLDADEEILECSLPDVVGTISFVRDSDGQSYERARLYRWRSGFEFRGRHYDLWDGDRLIATLTTGRDAEPCGTGLHHDICSRERQRRKDRYYRYLSGEEAEKNPQGVLDAP